MLPVDCIEPSLTRPGTAFDEPEIAASRQYSANGLLQPISVRRGARKYQLIAGERRLRACRLAKLESTCHFGGLR